MYDQPPALEPVTLAPSDPEPDRASPPIDLIRDNEFQRFVFTGSGKEYFRIWIVNLALTVATLGIYSAWAKVRRLQYFDRNTQLGGATFDFDGSPWAILRGRVLALGLVGSYHYAVGFSQAVTIALMVIMALLVPALVRGALRFRLGNTRYRGLRLHFDGSLGGAYLVYLGPVVVLLALGALVALFPRAVMVFGLVWLLWPLLHGAMKRYQHGNIGFGTLRSQFDVPLRRFYSPYLRFLGFSLVLVIAVGLLSGTVSSLIAVLVKRDRSGFGMSEILMALIPAALGYLMYLLAGPYLKVRLGNLVWSHTSFPGVSIASEMEARSFIRLQIANTVLTLLTLGLYRPFAVVRTYEYRLAHVTVITDGSIEQALTGVARTRDGAGGDGAAEFLGVDLSW